MTSTIGHYRHVKPRLPVPQSGRELIGQDPPSERETQTLQRGRDSLAEGWRGVTTNGVVVPDLFALRSTGQSTKPAVEAGLALMEGLSHEERETITFPIDSDNWRLWANGGNCFLRHGIELVSMEPRQRDLALGLMQASLSARGFELTRTLMKLNDALGDIVGESDLLGEWYSYLSIFGTPSATEPWGWQLDGHHLNINCFVLGDQIVLTPTFMGAEPRVVDEGRYAGLRAFDDEEGLALELVRALTPEQQKKAILFNSIGWGQIPPEREHRTEGRHQGGAFRDNIILPFEGVTGGELSAPNLDLLTRLIETYTGRVREGHDLVAIEEVMAHLDSTHFAWMGGTDDDSPFYYKIHSPVILIEFDHHHGVFLDNVNPEKFHVHTIVRTPNGNDYGKDLLRQHYEMHHVTSTSPLTAR